MRQFRTAQHRLSPYPTAPVEGKLSATDPRIAAELDLAEKNLDDAERRNDRAGRAAFATRDPSSLFIQNELHRIEQTDGR